MKVGTCTPGRTGSMRQKPTESMKTVRVFERANGLAAEAPLRTTCFEEFLLCHRIPPVALMLFRLSKGAWCSLLHCH